MAPNVATLSAAALGFLGSAVATQFTLSDVYNASNFADKFNFITANDANAGYVVYQAKDQALSQGLFAIRDNEVYVGVDHTSVLKGSGVPGRNSLRLESMALYTHGLIVGRFTHLPSKRCGAWPAFWTFDDAWPNGGEIDLYEGWNENTRNQPAFHVGSSSQFGACRLDGAGQTSQILSSDCDNAAHAPPQQYAGQGCTAADSNGPWASSSGGTYAIEWTSQYIKLFSFSRGSEPANLASANPDTALWGTPSVFLKNSQCNIDAHFQAQRLVLDIAFCGNPPGTDAFWKETCAAKTGQSLCADYVAKSPGDFSESYFQIQDIRYFTPQGTSSTELDKRAVGNDSHSLIGAQLGLATGPGLIVPQSTRLNLVVNGSQRCGPSITALFSILTALHLVLL